MSKDNIYILYIDLDIYTHIHIHIKHLYLVLNIMNLENLRPSALLNEIIEKKKLAGRIIFKS